jgi:hypothetical protein
MLGKADHSLFVTTKDVFELKNIGLKCSHVLCISDNTVIFCSGVVRSVHKFYFRLVINDTSNECQPAFAKKKLHHTVTETLVFDRIYVFPQPSSQVLRESTYAVQVNCIPLSKGRYQSHGL